MFASRSAAPRTTIIAHVAYRRLVAGGHECSRCKSIYLFSDAAAEARLVRRPCFLGLDPPPHLLHLCNNKRQSHKQRALAKHGETLKKKLMSATGVVASSAPSKAGRKARESSPPRGHRKTAATQVNAHKSVQPKHAGAPELARKGHGSSLGTTKAEHNEMFTVGVS